MIKSIKEKIDSQIHLDKTKFILFPPMPKSLKIEITSRCNFKCKYCGAWKDTRPKGDINKELLYKILKEAKELGIEEIGMFLLGESFLVEKLPLYIEYAKKELKFKYVFITTNGSLCTVKKMKEVIEAGLDSIKFSINASSKEKFKEIHGVDMFDTVINNIKWLHELKPEHFKTCCSAVYLEEDKKELENLKKLISFYVDEFYFLPLYNQAGMFETNTMGNTGRKENPVSSIPCWSLFNVLKVTWDGWLTACCFDNYEKFKIADLNRTSLSKAWCHPKIVNLRKLHIENKLKNSICAKCLGIK